MGFTITEAYIINTMYVCEINFQGIYLIENSKEKVSNILQRHCLLFQSAHLAKTVFPVPNKLPAISALLEKKN